MRRKALESSVGEMPAIIGFIDGTKQRQIQPKLNRRGTYSGHLRASARTAQCVSLYDGRFVDVEAGFPGAPHDAANYQNSELGQNLDEKMDNGQSLGADKGYIGQEKCITPYRENQMRGNPQRRVFNSILNKHRSVVERSFGFLKSQFRAIDFKWRHIDRDLQADALLVSALLANRIRRLHMAA